MDTSRYEIYFRARDSNRFLGLDFCTEELSILFFFFWRIELRERDCRRREIEILSRRKILFSNEWNHFF